MQKIPARNSDTLTNAMWFGSKVSINDIKLITLTLIRAGVGLRIQAIRPFRMNDSDPHYEENVIEIGSDAGPDYQNKTPLSVDDIVKANSFDRN